MGLDVYLYKCNNLSKVNKIEEKFEKESEKIWGQFGEHPDKVKIEMDSKKYPQHMFKIGYFRSSYNDGGINSVLERLGFGTLYDIFPHKRGECYIIPDWEKSLRRVNKIIKNFKKYLAYDKCNKFDVIEVSMHRGAIANNGNDALKVFKKEYLNKTTGFRSYSSKEGTFYLDGIKIFGAIQGKNCIGSPCMYLIYEKKDEDTFWYLEALEIVKETIEYVLSQKDMEDHYFSWSG